MEIASEIAWGIGFALGIAAALAVLALVIGGPILMAAWAWRRLSRWAAERKKEDAQ